MSIARRPSAVRLQNDWNEVTQWDDYGQSASAPKNTAEAYCFHPGVLPEELRILMVGIGGLGVANLTRRLRDLIADRYCHVCTAEQRGVAQRRASTAATLVAGRSVCAPSLDVSDVDILIGLEPLEALRYRDRLRPGSLCLLSDVRIETICGGLRQYADTREIVCELEWQGAQCVLIPLAQWHRSERMEPVYASSVMLGLFCAVFDIDIERAKTLAFCGLAPRIAHKNIRAMEWGFRQFRREASDMALFNSRQDSSDYILHGYGETELAEAKV
ncbi:2-oxoacid:acceptor oxidoreductase family protein [Methylocaldum szegediense]|uniref:POR domain-containing protein n=1 Tax=Methylocaldum szegediense TaxID=73780 RepID=A0ABM9I757_9GAMM|nr:2-oxoacid:acceptor oxidoreductase family protein [Methylocaldum szegediense]CAI8936057.1 POR domain-containing protein [Methylocaldum szegediense]